MAYKLPLAHRLRVSETRRTRYRNDPAYRLRNINAQRRRCGKPEIASLDELTPRVGRVNAVRDEQGRFV